MGVYLHNETIILQKWSSTPKYYTTQTLKQELFRIVDPDTKGSKWTKRTIVRSIPKICLEVYRHGTGARRAGLPELISQSRNLSTALLS